MIVLSAIVLSVLSVFGSNGIPCCPQVQLLLPKLRCRKVTNFVVQSDYFDYDYQIVTFNFNI
jgi:hypothetical protein